jgi:Acetyltransferase (GNAT) domain
VLETSRLILRPWREEDLPKYLELFSYPEVTRYTLPIPRERVEVFAADFMCQWSEYGFGPFAIDQPNRRLCRGVSLGQVAAIGEPVPEWAIAVESMRTDVRDPRLRSRPRPPTQDSLPLDKTHLAPAFSARDGDHESANTAADRRHATAEPYTRERVKLEWPHPCSSDLAPG